MHQKRQFLLIMRHAKSDHSKTIISDFDRPLNNRGQTQPANIAQQLNQLGLMIDIALISPAQRTKQTWELLASHLEKPPEAVFVDKLYNASFDDFLDVLTKNALEGHNILVLAHCPGVALITEFLTGVNHDFKTADVAVLSSQCAYSVDNLSRPHRFHLETVLTCEQ